MLDFVRTWSWWIVVGAASLTTGLQTESIRAQNQGQCFILCSPELKVEPTVTIENLFGRPKVARLEDGEPVETFRAERNSVFEMILAVGIPTEIPRVSLTFEAIWTPFATTDTNVFTGTTSNQLGVRAREAYWVWVKVAIYSFGGPAGQIAVMHRLLVDEKRWVSENRFLHALNYCMLLPGPEAQQLAIYVGWLLHKVKGGLVASILFVLPGFITILVLSILYADFQDLTFVQALFFGLKPAVVAVVVEAVLRIGRRVLKNRTMVTVAALAFIAIFFP